LENYAEITGLLYKHLRSELTREESAVIDAWVAQSKQNRQFFEDINNTQALMADVRAFEEAQEIDVEAAWNRIQEQAWEKPVMEPVNPITQMKRRHKIAAVVLGLTILIPLFVAWFVQHNKPANLPGAVHALQNDARPNSNHAFLTLDNGATIVLDSANNGSLGRQGSVQINNIGREVVYAQDDYANSDEVLYNKITVPNGGDVVALELADGSKVWLNAGSTISYPVSFDKSARKVAISGEAYFEVAASSDEKVTPFIVSKGDLMVTVLGTIFNVNSYDNEDNIKITLLDGSAKVQFRQSASIIKRGEQAILNNAGISVTNNVDVDQVIAWKKGIFQFNNTNIQPIMRQLERWYDLAPARYENEADKKWNFNGQISRYNNASDVLKLLEKTGVVQFVVKEKKIIVKYNR
jgi:transmembrane sensor